MKQKLLTHSSNVPVNCVSESCLKVFVTDCTLPPLWKIQVALLPMNLEIENFQENI